MTAKAPRTETWRYRQQHRPWESDAGKNPVPLAWLVRRGIAAGKPSVAYVRSQRQYCILSEDRHRLVVTRDLELLTFELKINEFPRVW